MKVEMFELGPVSTNAYLVYCTQAKEGVVIDPGMYPRALCDRISQLGLTIKAILLTHAHFDHIGGVEEVRKLTKAPVYVHQIEEKWLTNPQLNGSGLWPGIPSVSCQPADVTLTGGQQLTLLNNTPFQVIHTPGHSPGSVTFVSDLGVFSGDVLFKDSIGRTDLPGGDYKTLLNSISRHFFGMKEETKVFPGHGPLTTIGREKKMNPFLKSHMK